MNARTIRLLAQKDLFLMRWPLALYVACGLFAAVLAQIDDRAARSLGVTLAINVFIAANFHLVLGAVLGERQQRTLAFTLALPVAPREVTAAKLVASIGIYLASGLLAAVALVALSPVDVFAAAAHDGRSALSHFAGWIAYFALTLGGFLVFFSVALATAIVSESLGWTIAVVTTMIFVVGNGLTIFGPRLPAVVRFGRALARGGPELGWTIAFEWSFVAVVVAATFWLASRKRSYL